MCMEVLREHASLLQRDSMVHQESLRSLVRAVATHEKDIMRMCDENHFSLSFLQQQLEAAEKNYEKEATNGLAEEIDGAVGNSIVIQQKQIVNNSEGNIGKQPKKKQKKNKGNSSTA